MKTMTDEEYEALVKRLDEHYVLKKECTENQDDQRRIIETINVRIVAATKDIKIIKWLLGIIASSIVTALVTSFLGLIFK